jgi:hypothetical protein
MSNLRRIREVNWDEIEALEMKLLREMTVEAGIREYLALRREFEPLLQRDDAVYGLDYEARLVSLQERLQKLQVWKGVQVDQLYDALVQLQRRLDEAGIPSVVIGGLALGAWSKARVTRDVDLKILLRRDERQRLLDLLRPDYRFIHADPDEALRRNGVVFALNATGVRLDLMLVDTEFDEILIARARAVELMPGQTMRVCSPEDLIVLKMIAFRPQDQIDVERVIERQGDKLDDEYILGWLSKFEKMLDDSTLLREYTQMRDKARRLSGLGI